MHADEDDEAVAAMADLEDACGDLFGLPAASEIARREAAFARVAGGSPPSDKSAAGVVIDFPKRKVPSA